MSENLAALLPPLVVLALFVVVIRVLMTADRRERAARQKIDAEIKRRGGDNSTDGPIEP